MCVCVYIYMCFFFEGGGLGGGVERLLLRIFSGELLFGILAEIQEARGVQ